MSGRAQAMAQDDWKWVTLADVAQVITGNTPPTKEVSNYGDEIPFVKPPELIDRGIRSARQGLSARGLARARTVPAGGVLVSCIGGLGKTGLARVPVSFNQQINALVFRDGVLPEFGFYYAQTLKSWLYSVSSATTLPIVNKGKFRQAPFPLAPLEDQRHIVAEIEKQFSRLDEAVANLKRVKANLKRYKAAVLKAAVEGRLVPTEAELARRDGRSYERGASLMGLVLEHRHNEWRGKKKYTAPVAPCAASIASLPEGWAISSLEAITSANRVICYGILMPKENVKDGILYVKVRDMKFDVIDLPGLQRTSREIAAKYARASLRTGDLLLSIRGTYGRVATVPPDLDGGNITQDTARIDVSPLLLKEFIAAFLRSDDAQQYFKRVARGVAVKGVNIGDIRPMTVPIPPLTEQRRIVDEIDRRLSILGEVGSDVDANLKRAQALRQATLNRAFTITPEAGQ